MMLLLDLVLLFLLPPLELFVAIISFYFTNVFPVSYQWSFILRFFLPYLNFLLFLVELHTWTIFLSVNQSMYLNNQRLDLHKYLWHLRISQILHYAELTKKDLQMVKIFHVILKKIILESLILDLQTWFRHFLKKPILLSHPAWFRVPWKRLTMDGLRKMTFIFKHF